MFDISKHIGGNIVSISLDETCIPCLVLQLPGGKFALVPMGDYPNIKKLQKKSPLQVTADCFESIFVFENLVVVPALIGEFIEEGSKNDARQYYRTKVSVIVDVSDDERCWRSVRMIDLSEGGFMASDNGPVFLREGQVLALRIHIPKATTINARGIIKRVDKKSSSENHVVIRFTQIAAIDNQRLVQYIYQCQRDQAA